MGKNQIIKINDAVSILHELGDEYAVVQNPDYIYPASELYPLAFKSSGNLDELAAVLMDMDGTTTTTEELCIHSLEYMIRKMSCRMNREVWEGLDPAIDYPHIIGNSTTKHVEYLISKYSGTFVTEHCLRAYIYAAVWTLLIGKDEKRQEEVKANLCSLNAAGILDDVKYMELSAQKHELHLNEAEITNYFYDRYSKCFNILPFNDLVRLGIDIYYQRYHQILERIKNGQSELVSSEIFNDSHKHLIEPMPGVEVVLPLIKGWLGEDAGLLLDYIADAYKVKCGKEFPIDDRNYQIERLKYLGRYFENKPAKAAIVTSSILYEADIVISEVFKIIITRIDKMNLPAGRKTVLKTGLSNYQTYYDAIVTASDSNEIRLKPHRDLYSIALHKLAVPKNKFQCVAGFEDSESGTIAIRAAGIGLCTAVPFAQTNGHNFEAAAFICPGGLPEVLLKHNLFMKM